MANLKALNGDADPVFIKATGAGTDADPLVMQQAVSMDTSGASGDAFGRLRVSNPETIYAQKFLYGEADGTFFDTEVNGTGTSTHVPADSCINMAVSANADFAIRQSRQRINYQAGKSQLYYFTGIMTPTADVEQRIGCFQGGTTTPFDVLDGICFEADGADMYVKIYKGGSENGSAVQSAWNIDPMDGTGPSGVTIDWTKCQIFVIDYEWLGVGRVRLGLNVDGRTYYVHAFNNANSVDNVYMRSPNQPIRYEIRSTGGSATMKQICCSAQSEGGASPSGLTAALVNDNQITIGTTFELLLAIRLKPTQLDATVLVEKINSIADTSGDYEYAICWNPVIGGTPAWTDVTGAAVQEWIGTGAETVTPTIRMDGGFNSSDTDAKTTLINSTLRLGSEIDGTQDVIALAVRSLSGTENFSGTMTLRQLI